MVTDPPAGISFMGKAWDDPGGVGKSGPGVGAEARDAAHDRYGKGALPYGFSGSSAARNVKGRDVFVAGLSAIFAESLRVLKPGAHALVWAISRTSHWTATALEDAGFEIRDVVVHLFGTGFPKSLDVSKAIDKAAGHWRGRCGTVRY